ncbi:hypothetical protein SFRURICE_006905 [Spodoptera frugiperda]|nr:hypothetical protein SFRURICE_006905 [Spodoptera frugiperda]
MPRTRHAARAAMDADRPSDVSDREIFDEATEQSPVRAPELVTASDRAGISVSKDTETFLTNIMESFIKMQADTNRCLIETLRSLPNAGASWQSPSSPSLNTTTSSSGNFAKCTARFTGTSQEPEVLEAFIDAVQVYKECADVSDDHALRGLPMLLEGDAAVWWRGARNTITTWKDAVFRLRSMYGTPKPAYKILREMFSQEQKDERAEVFVCKLRSLIVKLPYEVPLPMQIDIIYGLLHRRVRKRLQRSDIVDIHNFVEKVRVIEDAISELSLNTENFCGNTAKSNVSCSQVLRDHHNNKIESTTTTSSDVTTDSKVTSNSNENSKRDKHVRCKFCKSYGHSVADCRNLKNKQTVNAPSDMKNSNNSPNPIRCYGCGQVGVVRSKCERCLGKSVPPRTCDFNTLSDDETTHTLHIKPPSHPTVYINIADRVGAAVLDTGASCTIAGTLLYKILISEGIQFCESERTIGLADGSRSLKRVLIATVPVWLEGRLIVNDFLVLPGEKTVTLLGRDFITKAGVTLDLAQESWYFADNPEKTFSFVRSVVLSGTELMQANISDVSLRADEGNVLSPEHRDVLNVFLKRRSAQFAAEGPPTDFATHKIKITQEAQKKYADESRRPAPDYKVGDLVLLKTQGSNDTIKGQTPKFIPRRDGPYRIQEVIGSTTYALERINDGVSLGRYHVSLLTPFVGPIQAPIQVKRRRGRPRKN